MITHPDDMIGQLADQPQPVRPLGRGIGMVRSVLAADLPGHAGLWNGGTVILMGLFGRLALPRVLAW